MSSIEKDNLVDAGKRSTERSRETALRWVGSVWHVGRERAAATQEFVRDRVRSELDALGVANRADLDRATASARQATESAQAAAAAAASAARTASTPPPIPAPVVVPAPVAAVDHTEAITELRDSVRRGFELLAHRIDAVAGESKAEMDALRREFSTHAVEMRAGFDLVQEEITGVGRATRRDLERVRNEMTQLEAAIREGTDRMVEAMTAPRPLLASVHEAMPAPIEIRPDAPVAVEAVEAVVIDVADAPRRNGTADHPAGQRRFGSTPASTSPPAPAPVSADRVRTDERPVADESPRTEVTPLSGVGTRSGRIGAPQWSSEPRPSGPIVDLSNPDPDEPPLSVTDLRAARVPPPG